jgi:hypothetical protein
MNRFRSILRRVPRVPHRLYWEIRFSVIPILWVAWLWWLNKYGRSPITAAKGPVVSLTTHGKRMQTVYLTIESIARGYTLPSRLILWLDDRALYDNLPATIQRQVHRGLEVRFCKNYGPHTKYYPYLESEETFFVPLVTADDDMLYPRYWLNGLANAFQKHPDVVNCFWALVIQLGGTGIIKFSQWKICDSTKPSVRHHALGFSGVIYPPAFLSILKKAGTSFEDCCPKADDIWLHVQALRAGYKIRQIRRRALRLPSIPGTQGIALWNENRQGRNDLQVTATYTNEDVRILMASRRHHDRREMKNLLKKA